MQNQYQQIITVFVGQRLDQIAESLAQPAVNGRQSLFCDNVYEALATILQSQYQAHNLRVYVTVDNLAAEEMEIFSCLAHLENIHTVAVSRLAHSPKLAQASKLGANETLHLRNGSIRAASPVPITNKSLPTASPAKPPDQPPPPNHLQPVDQPPPPEQTPPTVHKQPNTDKPLLSDEELDALLDQID